MRKAILLFAITVVFSIKSFGQGLAAKIDFNQSKVETGLGHVELSFVLNSNERSSLDAEQLKGKILHDERIKECIVLVDDSRPKAAVVLNVDIVSGIELKLLFRNLFQNLNLEKMILNNRVFVSSENIEL